MLHNAAIALLVASSLIALGAYVVGHRDYDRGRVISTRTASMALTGVVGTLVAVALLAIKE